MNKFAEFMYVCHGEEVHYKSKIFHGERKEKEKPVEKLTEIFLLKTFTIFVFIFFLYV